ncbi:MAG: thioesterase family protein [Bacteroidota bacterium]
MRPFREIFQESQLTADKGQTYYLDESWMQGRAIYGGLSTALCLDGVKKQFENLPPLRSTNVNFIGPASKEVYVKTKLLRQGKSVAFVQADLMGEAGLITTCVFSFGAARESKLAAVFHQAEDQMGPESSESFFEENESFGGAKANRPAFTQHFEVRLARGNRPFSGAGTPSFDLWVKHKDASAKDIVALVALADMPPPGVLPMLKSLAPISSMSWMFNMVKSDLSNDSGWWLLGVYAEHALEGYSSQNMSIHNDRGELVMVGRQNVAVFY